MTMIRLPVENFYFPPHPLKQPHVLLEPAQILGDLPERLERLARDFRCHCHKQLREGHAVDRYTDGPEVCEPQQDANPFLCPHCGKECKTWFDRTMDEQGRMATRCEHCGRDVGEDAKPSGYVAGWCPTCRQHKGVMGGPCNDPWHAEQLAAIGRGEDAKPERCPHGVLLPHECRECEAAIPDDEVKAFAAHMEREAEEQTKPGADEAAVEAISKAGCQDWEARAILAAIRAGKVPGIWCGATADNIASAQLVAALRRENEALKAQSQADALELYKHRVRGDGACAERDKALAELAAEHAKLPDFQRILAAAQRVNSELEKALSDTNTTLIEARETYRRAMAEITAERDQLKADLAAMTERAEKAESLVDMANEGSALAEKERDDATARADHWEALLMTKTEELRVTAESLAIANAANNTHICAIDAARDDADVLAKALRALRKNHPPANHDSFGIRQMGSGEQTSALWYAADAALAAHDARKEVK